MGMLNFFRSGGKIAWGLIGAFPYTRLVHALSLPLGYVFRPYIVYPSREADRGQALD